MSEYQIWIHSQGLVMHRDQEEEEQNPDYVAYPREVRYAISEDAHRVLLSARNGILDETVDGDVHVWCVRNVQSDTEDLPRPQWADGGTFPVEKFLELYEPVSEGESE